MLNIDDLNSVPSRVNLRKEFPIAIRSIFLRAFIWIVPFLVIVLVLPYFYDRLRPYLPEDSMAVHGIDMVLMVIVGISMVLMLGKIIYEVFYYIFYDYQIELEHVVITKGLFERGRASVPISKISDCSLQRGFLELLFNVYHLRIMTPSPLADLTAVEGLSPKNAVGLQNRLLSLVETTLPDMKKQEAEEKVPPPPAQETAEEANAVLAYDVDDSEEDEDDKPQEEGENDDDEEDSRPKKEDNL